MSCSPMAAKLCNRARNPARPNNGLQGMETRAYFQEPLRLPLIAFPPLKLGRYPTRPDVPRRQTHSCFSPNHCIGARHWMDRRRGYRPARDSPRLRPTFHDCNRVHSGWCCGAAHIIRQLDPVLRSYKELRLRARRSHRSRRCCFGP